MLPLPSSQRSVMPAGLDGVGVRLAAWAEASRVAAAADWPGAGLGDVELTVAGVGAAGRGAAL